MAVYQGARRRAPLPLGLDGLVGAGRGAGRGAGERAPEAAGTRKNRRAATTGASSARTGRLASRAARAVRARRPSSVGITLAAIVIIFGAAFLSLSQSVRVAATGYDIVRLVSDRDRLQAIHQDLVSDVERLRNEPAIRKQALDDGLGQLGAPLIIPAR